MYHNFWFLHAAASPAAWRASCTFSLTYDSKLGRLGFRRPTGTAGLAEILPRLVSVQVLQNQVVFIFV